jgi:hypothetical protein
MSCSSVKQFTLEASPAGKALRAADRCWGAAAAIGVMLDLYPDGSVSNLGKAVPSPPTIEPPP